MTSAPRLVVVGSANTDLVCTCAHLPAPGETILGGEFVQAAGGKGANQAVAAARLGAQVTFVARLGTDAFGDTALAGYAADGLDCTHVTRDPARPSGVALILVDQQAENVIVVAPGANAALTPAHVAAAEPAIRAADAVLAQLEVPLATVQAAADAAHAAGVRFLLNPAPMPADGLPAALLAATDVLIPNQPEAAALTGLPADSDDDAWVAALRRLGPPLVVLTQGARGALVVTPDNAFQVPAYPVTPVDTTAAGDAFCAAITVALARGADLRAATHQACAAGALTTTRRGAQPSLPSAGEVAELVG